MSGVDDDDLLDDPPPEERPRQESPRRRGRDSGGGGASALQQPGIRAMIAIGLLVVVVLILVSTIRGCQRDRLVDSYKTYVTEANAIAAESEAHGVTLRKVLLNEQFLRKNAILQQVTDLSAKSAALVERAADLNPPDDLKASNQTLITALEYRALGLSQLPAAIDQAYVAKDQNEAATTLANPLQILAASDTIFRTSYVGPTEEALQNDEIKDLTVTRSEYFAGGTYDLTSITGARRVINNLKQVRPSTDGSGATSGGKHGVAIASVFAVVGGDRKQLIPGTTVPLVANSDLQFEVSVENGGDFNEANVEVKVTYISPDNEAGTTETKTIPSIEPGETKRQTLSFTLPGGRPYLPAPSTLKVEAVPVPEETVTSNNLFEYPIEFNLT